MILDFYKYVQLPERTNDTITDAENLLTQNGKQNTAVHVRNVAAVNTQLAERFGLDSKKCFNAGMLHDISAVIKSADMLDFALKNEFKLCEAEHKYPFLLHQRISRIISYEYFGIYDDDILSAIECHTTLKKNASAYEMTLFIADKLAWDRDGIPPFYDDVNAALDCSLRSCLLCIYEIYDGHRRCALPSYKLESRIEWLKKLKILFSETLRILTKHVE